MSKSTLPQLDSSLYPQVWEQQTFDDAQALLKAMLTGHITPDAKAFTKQLVSNNIYQEWVNFTVFGRYIQRTFAAFYQQSEDSFNMDMPALFRHELMRHTQYLPLEQLLFVAGDMPKSARQEKLFTTTINPATAVITMQELNQPANKSAIVNTQETIINQVRVRSKRVSGFAMRHNKRTSERTRNEVLILDFNDLRLVDEQSVGRSNIDNPILLRCYELR
ncbi:hypothetical protein [Psychrobacter frigidicola]|uniref:hypothetical protein n=1 Tax=Psychrobacter frigidicola TaxID=45611 RepID=UPI0019197A4F|nr:hypothetical protein [Psychrobacter frigidicola]